MKRTGGQFNTTVALLGLAAALLAPAALAHGGPYLLPTSFAVTRDYVSVQGAMGNEVFFVPTGPIRNAVYYAVSPSGARQKLDGVTALKDYSVIEAPITEKGTYRLSTGDETARTSRVALIEGTWRMVRPANQNQGGQRPQGEAPRPAAPAANPAQPPRPPRFIEESALPADAKVIEVRSLARAETYVTKGKPTDGALKPSGQGFELKPITHPNDIYVDQGFEFELLEDGKSLPGVAVEIARAGNFYDEKKEYAELKTDANGRGKVKFDQPGAYILLTSYPAQRERTEQPAARSYSYTLTFEVMR